MQPPCRSSGSDVGGQMAGRVRGTRIPAVVVMSRAGLVLAGLLASLAACSSAPSQARPVAHATGMPAGYSEFQDSGRGYTLAVPSSWIQINVQSPDAAAAFAQLVKEKPQFAQLLGTNLSSLLKQNMSLLAVGPTGTGANMVVEPGSGTLTAAQLGTLYSTELQPAYSRTGITLLSHRMVSLGGYPALRTSITIAFGNAELPETQFFAGVRGHTFVLTISDATPTLINQIAGTVRFL